MDTQKIMDHPVDMGNASKPFGRFGRGVRAAAIGGAFASERAKKRFQVVGVNGYIFKPLNGVRMFGPGGLICNPKAEGRPGTLKTTDSRL